MSQIVESVKLAVKMHCLSRDENLRLHTTVGELRAQNARLKAALVSIVSGGEKSQPYTNEHDVLVREVAEHDYQACMELVDE